MSPVKNRVFQGIEINDRKKILSYERSIGLLVKYSFSFVQAFQTGINLTY